MNLQDCTRVIMVSHCDDKKLLLKISDSRLLWPQRSTILYLVDSQRPQIARQGKKKVVASRYSQVSKKRERQTELAFCQHLWQKNIKKPLPQESTQFLHFWRFPLAASANYNNLVVVRREDPPRAAIKGVSDGLLHDFGYRDVRPLRPQD